MRGVLLRAYLQPLKYMLQEQPKEKEAPQVLGSLPWQAQVRLQHTPRVRHEPDGLLLLQALPPPPAPGGPAEPGTRASTRPSFPRCPGGKSRLFAPLPRACRWEKHLGRLRRGEEASQTPSGVTLCLNSDVLTALSRAAPTGPGQGPRGLNLPQAQLLTGLPHTLTSQLSPS